MYKSQPYAWIVLAIMFALICVFSLIQHFAFPPEKTAEVVGLAGGLIALSWATNKSRIPDKDQVFMFLESIGMLILASGFGVALIYVGQSFGRPLYDETLIQWDAMIGFDWRTHLAWVQQKPFMLFMMVAGYSAMILFIFLSAMTLSICRKMQRLRQFVFAYSLSLLITVLVSSWWPAVNAYAYYNIDPAEAGVNPVQPRAHENDARALQNGSLKALPESPKGLASFPSFHAAVGVLILWAMTVVPRTYWLFAIMNIALVISTVSVGGHYLVDTLAGIVLALCAIWSARCLIPDQENKIALSA